MIGHVIYNEDIIIFSILSVQCKTFILLIDGFLNFHFYDENVKDITYYYILQIL